MPGNARGIDPASVTDLRSFRRTDREWVIGQVTATGLELATGPAFSLCQSIVRGFVPPARVHLVGGLPETVLRAGVPPGIVRHVPGICQLTAPVSGIDIRIGAGTGPTTDAIGGLGQRPAQ